MHRHAHNACCYHILYTLLSVTMQCTPVTAQYICTNFTEFLRIMLMSFLSYLFTQSSFGGLCSKLVTWRHISACHIL